MVIGLVLWLLTKNYRFPVEMCRNAAWAELCAQVWLRSLVRDDATLWQISLLRAALPTGADRWPRGPGMT